MKVLFGFMGAKTCDKKELFLHLNDPSIMILSKNLNISCWECSTSHFALFYNVHNNVQMSSNALITNGALKICKFPIIFPCYQTLNL